MSDTPRTSEIARRWSLKGGGTNTSDASPEAKELYDHAFRLEKELMETRVALAQQQMYTARVRERCLQAVREEPELPGVMPDAMFFAMKKLIELDEGLGGKEHITDALRLVVRQTKEGIEARINATTTTTTGDASAKAQT